MDKTNSFLGELYQENFILSFVELSIFSIIIFFIYDGTNLMMLTKPRFFVIILIFFFSVLLAFARYLTTAFLFYANLELHAIILWLYPFLSFTFSNVLVLVLLLAPTTLSHRNFWINALETNAKTSTALFTLPLLAFSGYIIISFFFATWRYLKLSLVFDIPDLNTLKQKTAHLESLRQRAKRFNSWAFLIIFFIFLFTIMYVIFSRPEVVLFCRGEIQLSTGLNPALALETFRHLIKKYPSYQYLDTVEFRVAWILDRRMKKYNEAVICYEEFLTKFGFENIWADDAITNLVKISVDDLKNFSGAVKWVKKYFEKFPNGHMAPHIAYYEIRALREMGLFEDARLALQKAIGQYGGRMVPIYNSEDSFVDLVPFNSIIATLNQEPSKISP